MTLKEFEDYALTVALDRYGVIASLVTRVLAKEERAREVQRIAGALHKFQSIGKEKRVSERTVGRWVSWYQHGHRTEKGVWVCGPGLDALKPTRRSDCGLARVLTPELVEQAVRLRKEEEGRSARTIIDIIQGEYKDRNEEPPLIEEHTLARHLRQQGVTRRDLAREPRAYPRYEQAYRNATWQGDWTQGIQIPDPVNPERKRMTHLHAFLDDHSRYIVHGEFYFRQNLPCLEDCFRKAILKGGIPERTYWDNGAVYQSRQIQLVAGRLGVQVVFATPYHPQGKGLASHCTAFCASRTSTFFSCPGAMDRWARHFPAGSAGNRRPSSFLRLRVSLFRIRGAGRPLPISRPPPPTVLSSP